MSVGKATFWTLVETCDAAERPSEIGAAFAAALETLDLSTYSLASIVDLNDPPPGSVLFSNVPADWIEHYKASGYHRINPVHREALRRAGPFRWSDAEFRAGMDLAQARYMAEVTDLIDGEGVTFCIRGRGALPASCSFVAAPERLEGRLLHLGHALAVVAHDAAHRLVRAPEDAPPRLTDRERQCLTLAAHGKSDWAISELVGVSEGAVHKTIERAKRRLGVATRVQAILAAIRAGEISMANAVE